MLGAIIGDIVGSSYEFNPTNDYDFNLFPRDANFTDDTICTIAMADALLRNQDFGTTLHEWCRKNTCPKGGFGGRFSRWVHSDHPEPYGSYGNGSAMRVSAIGWWSDTLPEVITLARKSAECTHNHPEGINGAVAVATAIMELKQWQRNYSIPKPLRATTLNNIMHNGVVTGIMMFDYNYLANGFELDLTKYRNKFDETCRGTVPLAFYIVAHSTSFEDAIRNAVSMGADADTLAAIVGSLAEPIWGIP